MLWTRDLAMLCAGMRVSKRVEFDIKLHVTSLSSEFWCLIIMIRCHMLVVKKLLLSLGFSVPLLVFAPTQYLSSLGFDKKK